MCCQKARNAAVPASAYIPVSITNPLTNQLHLVSGVMTGFLLPVGLFDGRQDLPVGKFPNGLLC